MTIAGNPEGARPAPQARRPASPSTSTRPYGLGPREPSRLALRAITAIAVVLSLHLARSVLIPVALAGFIAFLVSPLAKGLERLRVPRSLAAVASVLAIVSALGAVLWISTAQAVDLTRRLPEYRRTLEAKLSGLRSGGVASPIVEASDRLKELENGISSGARSADPSAAARSTGPSDPAKGEPVNVRVVEDEPTPLAVAGGLAGSVFGALSSALVVVFLAIFLLAFRFDVRERLLALGSANRLGVTAQALEEAGRRVARYLLSNLAVNAVYGAAVGLGSHLVGIPNAWLWGLLCGLLRFVPYVGTWIGAALPLAVSIAVFDGWGRTGAILGVILGIDLVVGNVVEPLVYGRRAGLSPLAVVLATVFWTWLWGIPGLLLAVPLTLCLAVVGRFVPGFGVFHVLLGDQPVLGPDERAYERLVVLDASGAARVLDEASARLGAAEACDQVLVSALRRAERDRREGFLDEERYLFVCDGVREVVEEGEGSEAPATATTAGRADAVTCLPAFAEADRVASEILARLLTRSGVAADVGPDATAPAGALALDAERAPTLCIVALPPFAGLRVRYGLRRARSRAPGARFFGVVLDPEADRARVQSTLGQEGAAGTAFTLAEALRLLGRPADAAAPDELPAARPPHPRASLSASASATVASGG